MNLNVYHQVGGMTKKQNKTKLKKKHNTLVSTVSTLRTKRTTKRFLTIFSWHIVGDMLTYIF